MHWGTHTHRARRFLRGWLESTWIGRVLVQANQARQERRRSICFVAATRMNEEDFWSKTLLGKRLKTWSAKPGIKIQIAFENRSGLPVVYNKAIAKAAVDDILIFLHDDAWLLREDSLEQIRQGLRAYDVIGIAGNRRRLPGQSTWYLRSLADGQATLDLPYLSGAVHYGQIFKTEVHQFGPWPAECELLDGVLLAARAAVLRRTKLYFDEQFDFHFYDLDFCRTARKKSILIGTWPIPVLHDSRGNPGDVKWQQNRIKYVKKWGD